MNQAQFLNDAEEAMRAALDGRQSNIWTAMPGIIQSVNLTAMTCEVQPAIQGKVQDDTGEIQTVDLPLLVDVPLVFPSGGGFILTFPIAVGDEVLVCIASRCIDSWWQLGGVQVPMEARMHDLSDGFAIPGPKSQPQAILTPSVSATEVQLRNNLGTTYLSITPAGLIGFQNPSGDLKTILVNLETAVSTFMAVLAAFAAPAAPVTQAMLQVPAATAVTQLSAVLVKIGLLLK